MIGRSPSKNRRHIGVVGLAFAVLVAIASAATTIAGRKTPCAAAVPNAPLDACRIPNLSDACVGQLVLVNLIPAFVAVVAASLVRPTVGKAFVILGILGSGMPLALHLANVRPLVAAPLTAHLLASPLSFSVVLVALLAVSRVLEQCRLRHAGIRRTMAAVDAQGL